MIWQDWILTSGTVLFAAALVPSIISKDKPALFTSLTTGLTLLVFAFVYLTLNLWVTAVMVLVIAGLWLTLAVQKLLSKK